MNLRFFSTALFVLLTASAWAEPKGYSGTITGRKVTGVLDWVDEQNVSGALSPLDAPERKLNLKGQNATNGKLTLTLTEGAVVVGTAALSKTTTAKAIVWSGTVTFADGNSGAIELQRPR